MPAFTVFAPAKLNLFLAVTGRRTDGFHNLVSLVVKLDFGDVLRGAVRGEGAGYSLACDDPAVPVDEGNLVLKAAAAFARAAGDGPGRGGADFFLEKRIPMGAGLGGGSSDAAAALRALNEAAGTPLPPARLAVVAAEVGSDCALFLHEGPVVMRGRGEEVSPLPAAAAARLRGRRVLVFKPAFPIATPWAYARLAAGAPGSYLLAETAEARLAAWIEDGAAPAEAVLFNNIEPPAFAKHLALPVLLEQLRREFALAPRMSGSGSACFALLGERTDAEPIAARVRAAWGESCFVTEARIT